MEIQYVEGWPQPYHQMDAEPYWEALEDDRLTFQRCVDCSEAIWPAHSHCPNCGTATLRWETSTGIGKVYSFSTVMRGPTPAWQSIVPYTVGFVELDEGYFLFTQIDAPPEDIAIGKPVHVRYIRRGDQKLPIFALSPD